MKTRACVWCCFLFMIFQYFFIMCFCFVQIYVCRPFFIPYYTLISLISLISPHSLNHVCYPKTHTLLTRTQPEKESWNIVARVVRLWFVEDYTKGKTPFSMEIVLPKTINAFYFFTFPKFFIFTHKFKYVFIFSFMKLFLQGVLIHASVRRTLIYKF